MNHANGIDRISKNTFCRYDIEKEMTEVGIAFKVLEYGKVDLIGWKKFTSNPVWDVKMDFTRKSLWVLDGHKTPDAIG